MACPQDINVTGMILALREADAGNGNVPDIFRKAASALMKDGFISIPKGRMETIRRDLGLPDVSTDENAVKDVHHILRSEGFPSE